MEPDPDAPVVVPLGDTLDLHTFRPSDVGSLVPEWLAECRAAGLLDVRIVHGKGTGALRAGVLALLDRSALVRHVTSDGNWGGARVHLWAPATDEGRVHTILAASPRLMAALGALRDDGPPDAWLGAGAVRNRVWHTLHRRAGEPDDTDLDAVWHGPGDAAVDAAWTTRLTTAHPAPWEVVDQARYGAADTLAGIARWPETATCVATRLTSSGVELFAAHGWADVLGMVVAPTPGISKETWRARLAAKRWRQRFPWVRIEGP